MGETESGGRFVKLGLFLDQICLVRVVDLDDVISVQAKSS